MYHFEAVYVDMNMIEDDKSISIYIEGDNNGMTEEQCYVMAMSEAVQKKKTLGMNWLLVSVSLISS
jgi:hypothetical protein